MAFVQVNGLNVERTDCDRVVEMIRAGGRDLALLVVDKAAADRSCRQPADNDVDVVAWPDQIAANASGACAQ